MSRVRCFVAADLSPEARDDLGRLQGRLRARGVECRWVTPAAVHLTLKFLGEVEPETFGALREALERPLGLGGPLQLAAAGVGAFPSPQRARVLWAGVDGDVAPLARAALEVEARAEPLGIAREARRFRAHLTLGRARGPSGIRGASEALEDEAHYRGPPFTVGALVLYESRLRPGGPEYVPQATIPL
ncbi:MAG: RNA 2',3'-cyclic phosphodiesterase [Thermodesulfobacteriota bacterium]